MPSYLAPEQLPPTFSLSVAKLILQDAFFLSQVRHSLPPEFFAGDQIGGAYLQQAVSWAYAFHDQYNYAIPIGVFDYWSQDYISRRPENEQQIAYQGITHLRSTLFNEYVPEADFVREHIYGWTKTQAVRSMLVEIKERIDQNKPVSESTYIERLNEISSIGVDLTAGGVDLLYDLGWTYNYLTTEVKRDCLPIGLDKLDKTLSGGVGRKEMLVIEAPPNTGKTTVMASFTANLLKQGKKVVHITLEQDEKLIVQKIMACLTGIKPHEFLTHGAHLNQWLHYLGGNDCRLMCKQFPTGRLTVEELYMFLRRIEHLWGAPVDVVVLDYADLMRSARAKDKRYEELAEIYTMLRGMAVEMNFALITATQTNRKGATKDKVTITDLAECFEKAAIADVIIALCQTEQEHRSGAMRFYMAKNRIGEKFIEIPYAIDYVLAYLEEKEMQAGWGAYPMPQTQATGPLAFLGR